MDESVAALLVADELGAALPRALVFAMATVLALVPASFGALILRTHSPCMSSVPRGHAEEEALGAASSGALTGGGGVELAQAEAISRKGIKGEVGRMGSKDGTSARSGVPWIASDPGGWITPDPGFATSA